MTNTKYLQTLGLQSKQELDVFIETEYKQFERQEQVGIVQTPVLSIDENLLAEDKGIKTVVTQIIREIKKPSPLQDPLNHKGYAKLNDFSDIVKYIAGKVQELELKKKQPF
jgi:hypothetical protein